MIIANAGDDQRRIVLLGLERENIKRLTEGQPIRVNSESHPGFPIAGVTVCIFFQEDMDSLMKALLPFMNSDSIIVDHRDKKPTQS